MMKNIDSIYVVKNTTGKPNFRPGELWLNIFIIALAIFILGVQIGIKHGRELQTEDFKIKYGFYFTD